MSAPRDTAAGPDILRPTAFLRILCGVDGSRADAETARQAAILAGGDCALTLAAVSDVVGVGLTEMATLSPHRAARVLLDAGRQVHDAGTHADARVLHGGATAVLLEEAARHDLLVVGTHGGSRAAGIALGSTASNVLHRSPVPVLVARRPPAAEDFPRALLVATDGTDGSRRAVALAAAIARRHEARVVLLLYVEGHRHSRNVLAEQSAAFVEATGIEPVLLSRRGDAHVAIVAAAEEHGVSLVVLGNRGLTGVRALGSVSERVAHEAGCSVLVAREGS
jgi:nucleotide-binding universal stress UspA family protein